MYPQYGEIYSSFNIINIKIDAKVPSIVFWRILGKSKINNGNTYAKYFNDQDIQPRKLGYKKPKWDEEKMNNENMYAIYFILIIHYY